MFLVQEITYVIHTTRCGALSLSLSLSIHIQICILYTYMTWRCVCLILSSNFLWKPWNMFRIYFHFFQSEIGIREKRFTIIMHENIHHTLVGVALCCCTWCCLLSMLMTTKSTHSGVSFDRRYTHCVILPAIWAVWHRPQSGLFRVIFYGHARRSSHSLPSNQRLVLF